MQQCVYISTCVSLRNKFVDLFVLMMYALEYDVWMEIHMYSYICTLCVRT
jgi:hypothetical protein